MNSFYINSLCYSIGWFWSLYFGISGKTLLALTGVLTLIGFQLFIIKRENKILYTQDLLLALFSLPLGLGVEIFLIQTGLVVYKNSAPPFPPLWILALYPLFSLLINHSLDRLKSSYAASFLAGFLAAPLSYLAGQKWGGALFSFPTVNTWIGIGTIWGLFLCLIIRLANIIHKAAIETQKNVLSGPLKLLYDGDCPLCQKEISFLKKRAIKGSVTFVDISSKDFSSIENHSINYTTAMSEIHAIDSDGKLLIGVEAFAALYARCQLPVLATALNIPFISSALKPFYKLFAKNRLRITGRCPLIPKK